VKSIAPRIERLQKVAAAKQAETAYDLDRLDPQEIARLCDLLREMEATAGPGGIAELRALPGDDPRVVVLGEQLAEAKELLVRAAR
jgi:hypothetical protein